ncbi:hypothetical protein OE88DRAFT_1668180 [Heliocybe sulcata]|uniref:Uncharacterized protein n=1 Tax=Heliocybe sulcata TaxID=5364 RepID=A0A5C3MNW9_9AGAM|nr:hypothetical protein OE88DRAFT_1668180 [Heliocybe sulcata]
MAIYSARAAVYLSHRILTVVAFPYLLSQSAQCSFLSIDGTEPPNTRIMTSQHLQTPGKAFTTQQPLAISSSTP